MSTHMFLLQFAIIIPKSLTCHLSPFTVLFSFPLSPCIVVIPAQAGIQNAFVLISLIFLLDTSTVILVPTASHYLPCVHCHL